MRKETRTVIYSLLFVSCLMLLLGVQVAKSMQEDTFEVTVTIENIKNLYGFDIKLCYDTSVLSLVKATPKSPWVFTHIIKNDIDEINGIYWLAVTAVAPQEPFSGNVPIVKLTFHGAIFDETLIRIVETELSDHNGNLIPHVVEGLVIQGLPVHDVAVKEILGYPKGVYQGDPIYLNVTVENQGDFTETFTVKVYADQDRTIIGDEVFVGATTVYDLHAGACITLNLIWDTTNASCGHYFISAEAVAVEGEIDIADNLLPAGEYIGGVHPRPHVVKTANMLAQMISISVAVLLVIVTARYLKEYWFP